ncbi:hypothetical protein T440DRAFT_516134 [Plenodomus tracheiphilus IPT5]|uniref:PHD-type domain-containing protein n=1 Tax=Plenodomus tracheiphilus IPT5 TaxID=1408161 RepID=A0A6A7BDQ2_9PLEO|nr:hypothetical protein T440DRAFT_516134 [Plenodomus tracheiphilus IPT5]
MDPADTAKEPPSTGNGPPSALVGTATNTTISASSPQSPTPTPPSHPPHMSPATPAQSAAATAAGPSFPPFSASTAAILERLQGKGGHASGSAAFEAKRAEILQNYVTSDKLPTPPPIASTGRRGRGGRVGTPSGLKTEVGASPAGASLGRGSGRGRAKGRGSGSGSGRGRGGKRKRSDSDQESHHDDDDSDVSSSYTPLPTRTKSGRSVNKPVVFVPTIPEPSQGVKRRKSAKTMLAAKCKTCHRETDPANNRIVFCDACSSAYHQYCHTPRIDHDVVTVLEKEWLCGPCMRSKQSVVEGVQDLVAAERLSIEEKRAYFSTLTQQQLVGLLLTASIRHPELPMFPPDVQSLVPRTASSNSQPQLESNIQRFPQPQSQYQPPSAFHHTALVTSPPNMHTPTRQTPQSHNFSSRSETDPAEAQILGGYHSQQPGHPRTTMDLAGNQYDEDDGYDTDPPAHYPKPGNGLARTLRPESEDLNWLVDDNFEVFSHGWKGDGTGLGADGILDGVSSGTKVV